MSLTLPDILEEKAASFPDKPFLYTGKEVLTFRQLRDYSLSFASCFLKKGLKKGGRVAIISRNSPRFIFAFFGTLYAGGIPVPLNYFLEEEMAEIFAEISPSLILLSEELLATKQIIRNNFAGEILPLEEIPLEMAPREKLGKISFPEEAVILYTSGTLGFPRGVVLTHANLLSDVEACLDRIKVSVDDRFSLLLPLFHSFALTACLLTPLYRGAGVVISGNLQKFEHALEIILRNKTSIFLAIPQIFALLNQIKLPALPFRFCVSGGEKLPPEVEEEFERKFGIPLLQGYGLTETSPVVSLNPEERRKKNSVGLPLKGVEVRILKEGKAVSAGEEGEIVIRGPMVMKGYWKKVEETRKVIKGSYLYTGDMGVMDEDGYLYIMDRKKDMVVLKGLNVYPSEVERYILKYPGVKESAVVGINTERGEVLTAFVVCEKEIAEVALRSFLLQHLAHYKVPRKIEFLSSLPRNPAGKVKKHVLRDLYSSKWKSSQ